MIRIFPLVVLLLAIALPGAARAAGAGSGIPDEQILARAAALPPEERRYLVYLYARLNKPKVAESLAESILADTPDDRQTLLVLASMYLEQKDANATLRIARRFLAAYPGDHQGRYFLGAGHYLAKNYAEANRVLRELKREQFAGRKFPYETDLAAAAFAAGDWYASMLGYQELLRHHDLGEELRHDVRRALDAIYREHLPRAELNASQLQLDRASVWRAGALHGRHLDDRTWLEFRYARDDVRLESAPALRDARRVREEIAAQLAHAHHARWRSEAWVGVSDEGALGGARLFYLFARQREFGLEITGNARATDSLALEALDGRQHQFAASINWLIEADLALSLRAHAREVEVARSPLGRGTGIDVNLDQTLWRQGPRVTLGYRGAFARFSPTENPPVLAVAPIAAADADAASRRALVANLVSRRINRHGAGLLVTDNLADAWVYRLTAGVDYDFELSTAGWNGALALSFLPRKSVELGAEAGYTSSATASNAGSAARLVSIFVRIHF